MNPALVADQLLPGSSLESLQKLNLRLETHIDEAAQDSPLAEALRYSSLSGGKRFRASLLLTVANMFGVPNERLLPAACAVELLHTASLLLDDLPCMDDAEFRRWRKATHVVYGEADTILVAVRLIAQAYRLCVDNARELGLSARASELVVARVTRGLSDVCDGQCLDLRSRDVALSESELHRCYVWKTGGFVALATALGAIYAEAGAEAVDALNEFGYRLGVAFQLVDDILDRCDSGTSGKVLGGDTSCTLASLRGASPEEVIQSATERAIEALDRFGRDADGVREVVSSVIRERAQRFAVPARSRAVP